MDMMSIIKERRSVRSFQEVELPPGAEDALVEALIWAPSAGNLQSRKFYFVYRKEIKEALVEAAMGQQFIAQAPLTVVACTDKSAVSSYGHRGTALYMHQDVAASVQNLLLAAHWLGLATCWVGAFDEERVTEILQPPENLRPVAIVPVGYPARRPSAPPRVSREEAIIELR